MPIDSPFEIVVMLVLPAALGAFLFVNLLCACVALGVGFAAGVWFFGAKMAKSADSDQAKKNAAKQAEIRKAVAAGATPVTTNARQWPQLVWRIWPKTSPPTSVITPPKCRPSAPA